MTSGIYAIQSLVSGNEYLGQSIHIERRWREHRRDLDVGLHPNLALQAAWVKYGEALFAFVILEVVDDLTKLNEREHYHGETRKPEYNIRPLEEAHNVEGRVRLAHHIEVHVAKWRAEGEAFTSQDIAKRLRLPVNAVNLILNEATWWTKADRRAALAEGHRRARIGQRKHWDAHSGRIHHRILVILREWYTQDKSGQLFGYHRLATELGSYRFDGSLLYHLRLMRKRGLIDQFNRPVDLTVDTSQAVPDLPQFIHSRQIRENVLDAISSYTSDHPGKRLGCTTLARMVGITDQAAWKHLRALRQEGVVDGFNRPMDANGTSCVPIDAVLRPEAARAQEYMARILEALTRHSAHGHTWMLGAPRLSRTLAIPRSSVSVYLRRLRADGLLDDHNRPVVSVAAT
jgi:biotin operon repressor